ncbi:hypothetical protein F5Y12DRAFT_748945 [Xylaria sp. FL1777]|nr:hypothetical protein F5Y12DRAFT_748945 [Xylaria sp. FL1777]
MPLDSSDSEEPKDVIDGPGFEEYESDVEIDTEPMVNDINAPSDYLPPDSPRLKARNMSSLSSSVAISSTPLRNQPPATIPRQNSTQSGSSPLELAPTLLSPSSHHPSNTALQGSPTLSPGSPVLTLSPSSLRSHSHNHIINQASSSRKRKASDSDLCRDSNVCQQSKTNEVHKNKQLKPHTATGTDLRSDLQRIHNQAQCFKPDTWLSDDAIRSVLNRQTTKTCLVVNSLQDDKSISWNSRFGSRFISSIFKTYLFPCFVNNNHWILLCWNRDSQILDIWDSLRDDTSSKPIYEAYIKRAKNFINILNKPSKPRVLDPAEMSSASLEYSITKTRVIACPQQKTTSGCGIYVLLFAKHILAKAEEASLKLSEEPNEDMLRIEYCAEMITSSAAAPAGFMAYADATLDKRRLSMRSVTNFGVLSGDLDKERQKDATDDREIFQKGLLRIRRHSIATCLRNLHLTLKEELGRSLDLEVTTYVARLNQDRARLIAQLLEYNKNSQAWSQWVDNREQVSSNPNASIARNYEAYNSIVGLLANTINTYPGVATEIAMQKGQKETDQGVKDFAAQTAKSFQICKALVVILHYLAKMYRDNI